MNEALGLEFILACIGLALLLLIGVLVLVRRATRRKDDPWLDQMENPESSTTWPTKDGRGKDQS